MIESCPEPPGDKNGLNAALRAALEQSRDAVYVFDAETFACRYANERARRLAGRVHATLEGCSAESLLRHSGLDDIRSRVRDLRAQGAHIARITSECERGTARGGRCERSFAIRKATALRLLFRT